MDTSDDVDLFEEILLLQSRICWPKAGKSGDCLYQSAVQAPALARCCSGPKSLLEFERQPWEAPVLEWFMGMFADVPDQQHTLLQLHEGAMDDSAGSPMCPGIPGHAKHCARNGRAHATSGMAGFFAKRFTIVPFRFDLPSYCPCGQSVRSVRSRMRTERPALEATLFIFHPLQSRSWLPWLAIGSKCLVE